MEIIPGDFSQGQINVIKAICVHQLDSLKRLVTGKTNIEMDITLFLIQNEVTQDELDFSLRQEIKKFEELYNNPDDLRILSKSELSMFKHLLANVEKEWAEKYPNATKNLWHRLHIIEEVQGKRYTSNQMN